MRGGIMSHEGTMLKFPVGICTCRARQSRRAFCAASNASKRRESRFESEEEEIDGFQDVLLSSFRVNSCCGESMGRPARTRRDESLTKVLWPIKTPSSPVPSACTDEVSLLCGCLSRVWATVLKGGGDGERDEDPRVVKHENSTSRKASRITVPCISEDCFEHFVGQVEDVDRRLGCYTEVCGGKVAATPFSLFPGKIVVIFSITVSRRCDSLKDATHVGCQGRGEVEGESTRSLSAFEFRVCGEIRQERRW
ncbi:12603_t:CDS:2 [Acaulospora colombiana]|uniref:12603_t:CDS:1 n=1 Tax=Acaulospora colombiana TaxID=27376 RepID=A0ACA9LJX1_9GLOM|nr:12603_t:CDS:2 [Acaulospora colombiana]